MVIGFAGGAIEKVCSRYPIFIRLHIQCVLISDYVRSFRIGPDEPRLTKEYITSRPTLGDVLPYVSPSSFTLIPTIFIRGRALNKLTNWLRHVRTNQRKTRNTQQKYGKPSSSTFPTYLPISLSPSLTKLTPTACSPPNASPLSSTPKLTPSTPSLKASTISRSERRGGRRLLGLEIPNRRRGRRRRGGSFEGGGLSGAVGWAVR